VHLEASSVSLAARLVGTHCEHIAAVSFRPDEVKREAPAAWSARFGESWHSLAVQIGLIGVGQRREYPCPAI